MKKILFLLIGGLALSLSACKDDGDHTPEPGFAAAPRIAGVTTTTADVRCEASFDPAAAAGSCGFAYGPADASRDDFAKTTATVEGRMLSCRLTGLVPATRYRVFAFAASGPGTVESAEAEFTTLPSAAEKPVLEITSETELSVPAGADRYAITYSLYDPEDNGVVEAAADAAWIVSFDYPEPGRIAFAVAANQGAARTARITVSYPGAEPSTVTVAQAAGGGTPSRTKYAGWPELPVEKSSSDLYYAYHICPDFKVGGHLARNYTVCYSARNHCPVWVAAPRHACYEVKNSGRTEAYGRDPDIPSDIQYSSKSTGGGCNKGHMLGSAERLVTAATNRQVFYYSNIAPQYTANFNTGDGAWNNQEEFVDRQVCADTTYVVIGTWFESYTDAYGKSCSPATISFGGRKDVTRPSMFYYLVLRTKQGSTRKSVRDCTADELKCAAFVLRHNMEKGHEPQARDLLPVSEIEKLTGFTFFENVPQAPKQSVNPADWGL